MIMDNVLDLFIHLACKVGKRMVSERCPCVMHGTLIYYITWERGIQITNGLKVAKQLSLNRDNLGVSCEYSIITRGLKCRMRRKGVCQSDAGWERVKGVTNQEYKRPLESRRKKKSRN